MVKLTGYIVNKLGIKPDPKQVKAILQLKQPKNKKELQRIICMFNYLRDYVPKMADISSPIWELLKNNGVWEWSTRHSKALNELKEK